jgi:uncharacterized membrane-anchored protein YhcB (DUF1043 family)
MRYRRRGFALARSSRAAQRDRAVGRPLTFRQQEHQKKRRELLSKSVFNSAAEALRQIAHDLQALPRLQTP